ncbi:MAG: aspartate/tyrosine/aromatic aminotransferase [Granulosicoccus sp.]|nr:aspartate/tyrosine/aromatic aminotransferase [Granulosicoccus sp.]
MFDSLEASKPDVILALMTAFRADERPNKIDLGVGIYKNSSGKTPVMKAVQDAESRLLATQETKSYVGPAGDAAFCQGMRDLVLGTDHDATRARSIQTPGGSGALRVIADMLIATNPKATTWLSDPTWPNHIPIFQHAGHQLKNYTYYDASRNQLDFDAMMRDLARAKAGDIVLLHGCCHNPTGADLEPQHWQAIGELCNKNGLFPFVDLAYQGFGESLEADAEGARTLANMVPEMAVASSCSKNLSLYRERVGAALLLGRDASAADRAVAKLTGIVRYNYSMPPDHGASVTREIFQDAALTSDWKEELESMRLRMQKLRTDLAAALRQRSNSERFDYIAEQKGMFSRLPLTTNQIDVLREQHAIYIVGDGRMNVAGLPDDGLDDLASTLIKVMSEVD